MPVVRSYVPGTYLKPSGLVFEAATWQTGLGGMAAVVARRLRLSVLQEHVMVSHF